MILIVIVNESLEVVCPDKKGGCTYHVHAHGHTYHGMNMHVMDFHVRDVVCTNLLLSFTTFNHFLCDQVLGGMTWCLTACNEEVDIDLFFQENANLGQKLYVDVFLMSYMMFIFGCGIVDVYIWVWGCRCVMCIFGLFCLDFFP